MAFESNQIKYLNPTRNFGLVTIVFNNTRGVQVVPGGNIYIQISRLRASVGCFQI